MYIGLLSRFLLEQPDFNKISTVVDIWRSVIPSRGQKPYIISTVVDMGKGGRPRVFIFYLISTVVD